MGWIQCIFDPWIRDGTKNQVSETLKTIFGLKNMIFFDADADQVIFLTLDPGSEIWGAWIKKNNGSYVFDPAKFESLILSHLVDTS
jgi:hypothetical protein